MHGEEPFCRSSGACCRDGRGGDIPTAGGGAFWRECFQRDPLGSTLAGSGRGPRELHVPAYNFANFMRTLDLPKEVED